jgi:hypothetical protein
VLCDDERHAGLLRLLIEAKTQIRTTTLISPSAGHGRAGVVQIWDCTTFLLRKFRERALISPLCDSDFSGWVYLTLSKAKIEFKPIQPRNPWVDVLGFELGR